MAISKIGGPSRLTPAFNPVIFYYDSTNKNVDGFRYVVEVYSASTNTKIGGEPDLFIPPRIGDGICVANIGKILQSAISQDVNFSNTSCIHATNSYINYDIKIGESYVSNTWAYDDFEFYSSTAFTNGHIQLRQFASATTHTFLVGDQINIVQDSTANVPSLEGLHTVIAVPSPYSIIVDVVYLDAVQNASTVGGDVSYADNRKIVVRNMYNDSGYTAFNGAEKHTVFPSWDQTDYFIDSTFRGNFLTSSPDTFTILEDSSVYLNAFSTAMTNVRFIKFENSNGDVLLKSISATTSSLTGRTVIQISAGPDTNPTIVLSGTSGLIKSDTEWYDVSLASSTYSQLSQKKRYNINRNCRINDYEILFKDRKGSYLVFPAILRTTINSNITRKQYKQYLGDLSVNKWTYSGKDRGTKTYNVDIEDTYALNTPFMTAEESLFFKEMISSSDVYIRLNGEYWPCEVVDNSVENKTPQNNRLIKYGFSVKLANNDIVNA